MLVNSKPFDQLTFDVLAKAVTAKGDDFLDFCLQTIGSAFCLHEMGLYWFDSKLNEFVSHNVFWHRDRLERKKIVTDQKVFEDPLISRVIRENVHFGTPDPKLIPGQVYSEFGIDRNISFLLFVPILVMEKTVGVAYLSWGKNQKGRADRDVDCIISLIHIISLWRSLQLKSQELEDSASLINYMFDKAPVPIYQINLKTLRFTRVNERCCEVSGYTEEELLNLNPVDFLTPASRRDFDDIIENIVSGSLDLSSTEFEIKTKSGELQWGHFQFYHIYDNNEIWGANVVVHIITEQKRARDALTEQGRKLEALVQERTSELSLANQKLREEVIRRTETAKELRLKSERLKELNTAMRVLLDKRSEDRLRSEENIRVNLVQLIEPYIDRLNNSGLNEEQRQLLKVIKMNLLDVVGEPMPELSAKYYIFSPTELQVANLIRNGKTTKDIAHILNLSPRTVESYRNSIRKKLGLKNKKVNLKTFLCFKE